MDQRIVNTIHIAGLVKKILVLSTHIAATATNDIDLAPSRMNTLNEKYRITYRIVQGVVPTNKEL